MSRAAIAHLALAALAALAVLAAGAGPAAAGPLAALGGLLSGSAAAAAGKAVLGGFWATVGGRLLVSAGATLLSRALAPRPARAGIRTEQTLAGEAQPQTFVLGRAATGGCRVCPDMSHGDNRGRLTYVIDLGDIDRQTLEALIVDDEYVPVDWAASPHPTYGQPVTGRLAGHVFVKFRNGTQTAADPYLTGTYGAYDGRPWSADMIGRGVPHAILTFLFKERLWSGLPAVRFVVGGIPLYDPRADSTAGGSGPQRWTNRATWTVSHNPAVQIYNILRGIALPDGSVWGLGAAAADLPAAVWFAAMNACDAPVALAAGGSEPAYRTGLEVAVDDEPAEVIEELLKGCAGRLAEVGGRWIIRVGAPALPVMTLTDDDILVTEPQELTPYPGLAASWNAIDATYPEPVSLWEVKNAPGLTNPAWEAQDGGRRLTAKLDLRAVPYPDQVQRLMRAYIQDERRFRRHVLPLPPRFSALEPFDTLAWTSAANGYTAKLFEVVAIEEDLETMNLRADLREVDPADFAWDTAFELPRTLVPPGTGDPGAFAVPGWSVAPAAIGDGAADRRPGLALSWDPAGVEGARALAWELRPAGGATILRGTTAELATGALTLAEGLVAATAYELRARLVADAETDWTAWTAATTPDLRYVAADLAAGAVTRPKIIDYGVSDLLQVYAAGPWNKGQVPDLEAATVLGVGTITPGMIWGHSAVCEARTSGGGTATMLNLQRRRKIAGTWRAWTTVQSVEVTTSGWDIYAFADLATGFYDDFEYRLSASPASGMGGSFQFVREVYLTVTRPVK